MYTTCRVGVLSSEISKHSKISPPPSLRSHLTSSPMGVLSGDYGTGNFAGAVTALSRNLIIHGVSCNFRTEMCVMIIVEWFVLKTYSYYTQKSLVLICCGNATVDNNGKDTLTSRSHTLPALTRRIRNCRFWCYPRVWSAPVACQQRPAVWASVRRPVLPLVRKTRAVWPRRDRQMPSWLGSRTWILDRIAVLEWDCPTRKLPRTCIIV